VVGAGEGKKKGRQCGVAQGHEAYRLRRCWLIVRPRSFCQHRVGEQSRNGRGEEEEEVIGQELKSERRA